MPQGTKCQSIGPGMSLDSVEVTEHGQVLNVALDDDTFESQDVTVRDNTITPDERAR